jgi:hypothetical protein
MSVIVGANPDVHVVTVRRPEADLGPGMGPRMHTAWVRADPRGHVVHQVPKWSGSSRLGVRNGHDVHTPESRGRP